MNVVWMGWDNTECPSPDIYVIELFCISIDVNPYIFQFLYKIMRDLSTKIELELHELTSIIILISEIVKNVRNKTKYFWTY